MNIRNLSVVAALIYAALGSARASNVPWEDDKPCGRELPPMHATATQGCIRAYCERADVISAEICMCLEDEDSGKAVLTVERDNHDSTRTAMSVMPPTFEPDSFRLYTGDFRGDSSEQLMVAVMTEWGNGMGIEHWQLRAIDGTDISQPLETEDFGAMSFLTSAASERACTVFAATWSQGWEPKRGDGLYIVGRWYKLYDGELMPVSERPVLYRRYLFAVENERGKAMSADPRRPFFWYKSPSTRRVVGPYPLAD